MVLVIYTTTWPNTWENAWKEKRVAWIYGFLESFQLGEKGVVEQKSLDEASQKTEKEIQRGQGRMCPLEGTPQ